jgi:hypothetical protein
MLEDETKRREVNRRDNLRSRRTKIIFEIDIDSAHSRPQPVTRVVWGGEASGEGGAHIVVFFSYSYNKWNNPPYKEVQLSLNY